MKTRFDYEGMWITGLGQVLSVSEMETAHLLNTVRMIIQKPARTLSMLISDIESAAFSETVWTAHNTADKKQSLQNVTSPSDTELTEYAMNSPLFKSMIEELRSRGVNTGNIVKLFSTSESFKA